VPDYQDFYKLVRGSGPVRPLPGFWAFAPCHAGVVGGIPDLPRYYFDVDEKIRLQLKLKELLPQTLVLPGVFPDFGVVAEVSAFGGQLVWLANGAPFVHPCLSGTPAIDSLRLPEPGRTGLTTPLLIQQRLMKEKLEARGLELEKWALTMGPAEVAGLLLGYDKFYIGFYQDYRRIKLLIEMATEFIIAWLKRQGEIFGGAEVIMVADHVCNQVSPEHLEELILPSLRAIFQEFSGPITIYHNEGFHSDRHLELILDFGADVWHFGSDVHDLKELYARIGDRIVLFGGVNPHGAIRHGSPQEVRAETLAALEAARGRRILLSTGTGTTPEASLENVRAMVETVAQAGATSS